MVAIAQLMFLNLHAQNVGIGITNPQEKLHIDGNFRSSSLAGAGSRLVITSAVGNLEAFSAGSTNQVLLSQGAGQSPVWATFPGWNLNGNTITGSEFIGAVNNRSVRIRTNNLLRVLIDSVGHVVIGNPASYYSEVSVFCFLLGCEIHLLRNKTRPV